MAMFAVTIQFLNKVKENCTTNSLLYKVFKYIYWGIIYVFYLLKLLFFIEIYQKY